MFAGSLGWTINEAAGAYNEALQVLPTQVVARGFGLERAGLV